MLVTSVSREARGRMRICLDGEHSFTVSGREYASWNMPLEEGQVLDQSQAEDLMPKAANLACLTAMNRLLKRDYSTAELSRYLEKRGFTGMFAARAIEYVSSFGYLDDERMARNFIEARRGHKSGRMLEYQLLQKGIDKGTIHRLLLESQWDDREGIRGELMSRYCGRPLPEKGSKEYQKLCQSLIRKGYSYGDILHVMMRTGTFS